MFAPLPKKQFPLKKKKKKKKSLVGQNVVPDPPLLFWERAAPRYYCSRRPCSSARPNRRCSRTRRRTPYLQERTGSASSGTFNGG